VAPTAAPHAGGPLVGQPRSRWCPVARIEEGNKERKERRRERRG